MHEILARAFDRFFDAGTRLERHEARQLAHLDRLVALLGELKGAFAKAGQFASLRHDVLPRAVRERLAPLQDQVPPLPFPLIAGAIEESLGKPLAEAFSQVEEDVLGAASLAQVHRATLHDGRRVALKVQYPWLAASLAADLRLIGRLLALWCWWKGIRGLDQGRILREFGDGIERELDFGQEAETAVEIAANLAGDPQIEVPAIVSSHSSERLLCVAYHDVVGVADRPGLERLGVEPRAVLEILARAYAQQIFVDGLFHADPHPGNLFVLDEPDAARNPRVLFVDFGLSQRLDPSLRRELRQALYSILQRNRTALVDRMQALGMFEPAARDGVERAVGAMFDQIEASTGGRAALAASGGQILGLKEHAVRLLEETPGLQLPHDLLLYAKTLSYLFGLANQLDPRVDMMKLCLPYLLQFMAAQE